MAAVAAPPAPISHGHTPAPPRPSSSTSRKSSEVQKGSPLKEKSSLDGDQTKSGAGASSPKEHDAPQRPPIRPAMSKFDLEVNPFEQSFSRGSNHSSSSIGTERTTPPRGTDATSIKHNALPPLSSLTSPAAADPSQFPWLASQSLRTGPLSPAMLAGPQNGQPNPGNNSDTNRQGQNGDNNNGGEGGFDTSTFRTGFTPGTGSGFTPGYSSLVGNNFASSLPLPSPNTAAFLNMVTNSTPGGEGEDSSNQQSQPNQPQQQANGHQPLHPPSAIPPHLQPQHGLSHLQNNPDMPQETITPNTFSALTGAFNDMSRQQQQQQQQQQHMNGVHPPQNGFYPPQVMQPGPPQGAMGGVDYAQQSANAASQAANGLFLLSQAHQELSKREEQEGKGSSPNNKKSGKANGAGTKRKSDFGTGNDKPAGTGKKGRKSVKVESTSPKSMGDMDDDDSLKGEFGKGETEEDKRKNFLERNRQAALKCRQRKKAWLQELQTKVEQLTMDNERLQQTIGGLHEEVGRLSSILMQHRDCGLGIPTGYGRQVR